MTTLSTIFKYHKKNIGHLFLLLWVSFVTAEVLLPFTHYTSEREINPLPSASVLASYQDHLGFLWSVVISSGLVRYDGHKLERFTLTDGLIDLSVTSFVEDGRGYLWVGSDEGLVVSDKPLQDYEVDQKPHFVAQLSSIDLYPGVVLEQHLIVDKQGHVWLGTSESGLLSYRWQENQLRVANILPEIKGISALTSAVSGIWFSTLQPKQVINVDNQGQIVQQYPAPCDITALSLIASDKLWAGCKEGSLWRITQGKVDKGPSGLQHAITDIEKLQHTLWFSSRGSGVLRLEANGETAHITQNNGLLNNSVEDILVDREDNLWFSQNAGISKLRGNFRAFNAYSAPKDLRGAGVFSILEYANRVFVGTNSGLSVLGEGAIFESLSKVRINALCRLQDQIWVGTDNGLMIVTPNAGNKPYQRMQGTAIYACAELLIENQPMLGFAGQGRIFLWTKDRVVTIGQQAGLPSGSFYALTLDAGGRLLVGSGGKGIYRSIKPVIPGQLPQFEAIWNRSQGAVSEIIRALLWHKGQLWVGTSKGLLVLQNDKVIHHFNTHNGLKDNNIYSMSITAKDGLWVGTNKGLAYIDMKQKIVKKTITREDGLISNEVWAWGSVVWGKNNRIYFGTPKGLSVYQPDDDHRVSSALKPVFRKHFLKQDWSGQNMVDFEFSGMGFYDEKSMRYRSRMLGYDSTWSSVTSKTTLRYTNLPAFFFPTIYHFEVQARRDKKASWSTPLIYEFTINPAWWLQWWAFLFYLCFIVLLAYAYSYYQNYKLAQRNRELDRYNLQLQALDQMKDQFLSNISHELRTPLHGIIGIGESIMEGLLGSVSDKVQQNISLVVSSANRLSGLVNDIMDFSKLRQEKILLNHNTLNMYDLVDFVLHLLQSTLRNKNLILQNDLPKSGVLVSGDENRLQQILFNLVGNAIKFTDTGTVCVSAERLDKQLKITVLDTGIGIPEKSLQHIFEPFEQVDASTQRNYGGTGVGLSITRHLVNLHGGALTVNSILGEGSEFSFTLPLSDKLEADTVNFIATRTPPSVTSIEISDSPSSNGRHTKSLSSMLNCFIDTGDKFRILVVDDELVNRQVLANQLTDKHIELMMANDGTSALEIIEQRHPDLILLDVMMPGLSGYEVCQKIRKKHSLSDMPVLMVTAKNQLDDLLQGFQSGANDYIGKPFTRQELLARICAHLQIKHLNHALWKANKIKSAFLRNIGHELKTPLNLVIGYSDILLDELEEDGLHKYLPDLKKISQSGQNLKLMFDGLLEISDIESGESGLHIEALELNDFLLMMVDRISLACEKNNNQLETKWQDNLGVWYTDIGKLERILMALLNNATKFTQAGNIQILAQRNAHGLQIDIIDTGIGIDSANFDKIFDLFVQVDDSTTRPYEGMGIGLAIANMYCKVLKGSIEVSSQQGKGTTFRLKFLEIEDEKVQHVY